MESDVQGGGFTQLDVEETIPRQGLLERPSTDPVAIYGELSHVFALRPFSAIRPRPVATRKRCLTGDMCCNAPLLIGLGRREEIRVQFRLPELSSNSLRLRAQRDDSCQVEVFALVD